MNLFARVLLVILVLLGAGSLYLFVYEPRYHGLIPTTDHVLVFAHRGFGNHAPDNSLVGAEMAIEQKLDGVDVDSQLSKDGEVVIFHDVSLERFTTGTGRVDAHTLAELQTYDLGEVFGNGFSNVRIATFEDFVESIGTKGLLMTELKVSGVTDTGIEEQVINIIDKHDAFDRVYISSFNPVVLWRLKHIDPRVRTVFIFMDNGWDPARVAATKEEDRVTLPWFLQNEITRTAIRKVIRPDALSINKGVNEETIDTLLQVGYPIFLWPVDTEEEILWALAKHPYGLVSDEPVRARTLRDSVER